MLHNLYFIKRILAFLGFTFTESLPRKNGFSVQVFSLRVLPAGKTPKGIFTADYAITFALFKKSKSFFITISFFT